MGRILGSIAGILGATKLLAVAKPLGSIKSIVVGEFLY
jgi:hypothetical protein